METGIYEVINSDGLKIRREPRIIDSPKSNQVGKLTFGQQRQVYDVVTDEHNQTWGRISEVDATGNAEWVCLKGLNRQYMKMIAGSLGGQLADRLIRLEAWARTQGYDG